MMSLRLPVDGFYFYQVLWFLLSLIQTCLLAFNVKCSLVLYFFPFSHLCLGGEGPEGRNLPVSLVHKEAGV